MTETEQILAKAIKEVLIYLCPPSKIVFTGDESYIISVLSDATLQFRHLVDKRAEKPIK